MRTRALALMALTTALLATSAPAAPLANAFGSFNFTIDQLPAEQQVSLLQRLGYQGMTLAGLGPELLQSFAEVPAVARGEFAIWGALWWINADHKPLDTAWLDRLLPIAAKLRMGLWVVIDGPKTDRDYAVGLLRQIADRAKPAGVPLILYPHQGCVFDCAQEAYEVWQAMDRPEVRLSLHLCHEIKAGREARVGEVLDKITPLLSLVTISGADTATMRTGGWEGAIMPLARGDFDIRPFTREVVAHGYRGPIVLHTYGLTDPPEEHFAASIAKWRTVSAELGAEQQPNAPTAAK